MRYMRQYLVQLCSRPFISSHTSYSSNNMLYYNHLLISFNILFLLICSTRSYNSYLSGNAVPTSFHNTLGTLPPIVMRKRGEIFHLDLNQPPPEEESPQEVADSSAIGEQKTLILLIFLIYIILRDLLWRTKRTRIL